MQTTATQCTYTIKVLQPRDVLTYSGFCETLSSLTPMKPLSPVDLGLLLAGMEWQGKKIFVACTPIQEIVGTASFFVEQKIHHQGGLVGHLEDVATRRGFEGRGIASALIARIIHDATSIGCYKLIGNCKGDLLPFYNRFGFSAPDVGLRLDLAIPKKLV